MGKPARDITGLISDYRQGDRDALDKLVAAVYPELRRLANAQLRKRNIAHTLAPTALVHEAFLRLRGSGKIDVQDRGHFFAVAAQCMRWVLQDYLKTKRRAKRGGDSVNVVFDEKLHAAGEQTAVDLGALDAALTRLAKQDERLARVVELRYLAGLTVEQTAEALGASPATVKRDWQLAKVWLHRELGGTDKEG